MGELYHLSSAARASFSLGSDQIVVYQITYPAMERYQPCYLGSIFFGWSLDLNL